jgi:hypothetical protein
MTFALPDTTSDQPSCRFTRSTASAVFAIDARSPPASSLAIVASSPTAIASAFVGVARGAHRSRLRGVTYEHGEPGGRDANALPAFRLPLRVILAWRSSSVLAERSQQRRVCQQACLGKNTRTPARTPRGKSTRERGRGSLRGTFFHQVAGPMTRSRHRSCGSEPRPTALCLVRLFAGAQFRFVGGLFCAPHPPFAALRGSQRPEANPEGHTEDNDRP